MIDSGAKGLRQINSICPAQPGVNVIKGGFKFETKV